MGRTIKGRKTGGLLERTQRLKQRHQSLKEQIARLSATPMPDLMEVQHLDRLRRRVEGEMLALEGVLRTVGEPWRPDAA